MFVDSLLSYEIMRGRKYSVKHSNWIDSRCWWEIDCESTPTKKNSYNVGSVDIEFDSDLLISKIEHLRIQIFYNDKQLRIDCYGMAPQRQYLNAIVFGKCSVWPPMIIGVDWDDLRILLSCCVSAIWWPLIATINWYRNWSVIQGHSKSNLFNEWFCVQPISHHLFAVLGPKSFPFNWISNHRFFMIDITKQSAHIICSKTDYCLI